MNMKRFVLILGFFVIASAPLQAMTEEERERCEQEYASLVARLAGLYQTLAGLQAELEIVVGKIQVKRAQIQNVVADLGRYSDKAHPDYWVELKKLRKQQDALMAAIAATRAEIAAVQERLASLDCSGGGDAGEEPEESEAEQYAPEGYPEGTEENWWQSIQNNLTETQRTFSWDLNDPEFAQMLRGVGGMEEYQNYRNMAGEGGILYFFNDTRIPFGQGQTKIYNSQGELVGVESPIVLDMDGDGKLQASGGRWLPHSYRGDALVAFDINGDGLLEWIEWVAADDGLLLIYEGGEVNGNHLFGTAGGFSDGYQKLTLLDVNGDGLLMGEELKTLSVWQDNGDARADKSEISSVADLGITLLHTSHRNYVSSFVQNGEKKVMWDWFTCVINK